MAVGRVVPAMDASSSWVIGKAAELLHDTLLGTHRVRVEQHLRHSAYLGGEHLDEDRHGRGVTLEELSERVSINHQCLHRADRDGGR